MANYKRLEERLFSQQLLPGSSANPTQFYIYLGIFLVSRR